ncbi:hypothetical protein [Leptospira stimsonii]|uniref:Uncharacterized protein n=1 Tax=Leptospira stimsonii TaxID=2202203 RepID=A0ABY2MX63_9LEPT|nr:hypothetical protein [Leptospira stimsonii]TGK23119.1 hypothetical protein EHO98_05770 [Leptospira stimsonii]TGM10885.1 hypothetical protein EHQ90_17770 [Leptospira stimsonii]
MEKANIQSKENLFLESVKFWQNFINSPSLKYEKVTLGIVDILAYKNLLDEFKEKAPIEIGKIFADQIPLNSFAINNVKIKILSDTFIIYGTNDLPVTAYGVVSAISNICISLLRMGYLTRGAIVKGDHFLENDVMVSPAFVEANSIEKNLCIYPRIIITDEVRDFIFANIKNHVDGYLGIQDEEGLFHKVNTDFLDKDYDGFNILDYYSFMYNVYLFTNGVSFVGNSSLGELNVSEMCEKVKAQLEQMKRGILEAEFRTSRHKEKMKVEYLKNKFNKMIDNMKFYSDPLNIKFPKVHYFKSKG